MDSTVTNSPAPAPKLTFKEFLDRFSVGTNALEWLLTVPNLQIQYDLGNYNPSKGQYNNQSILLGARYNWNTWHQQPAYYVFNVLDVRGEYRYHFRFKKRPENKQSPNNLNDNKKKDKDKFWSLERNNPRPNRAYYIGGYGNYSQYSIKPGVMGYQGWQSGIGVVLGVERNLIPDLKFAIDFDLGLSFGLGFSMYDTYRIAASQSAYSTVSKNWILLPVVTELRATITIRGTTVDEKYTVVDPQIKTYNLLLQDINSVVNRDLKEEFDGQLIDTLFVRQHIGEIVEDDARRQKREEVLSRFIVDSTKVYRESFNKFVEQELMSFVTTDGTSRGKLRIRQDLDKKYMKKAKRHVSKKLMKIHQEFRAQLKEDLQKAMIQSGEVTELSTRRMSKKEFEDRKKEIERSEDDSIESKQSSSEKIMKTED